MSVEPSEHYAKFNPISQTALLIARGRAFAEIPKAQEIYDNLTDLVGDSEPIGFQPEFMTRFEARHKLINKVLTESGATQILEVAAGYSSRGLELTESEKCTYVEIDLPELMYRKKQILSNITDSLPSSLHLVAGSALLQEDMERATEAFDKNRPITIIAEGLMRYLDHEEKRIYANNVKHLLDQFGGEWITIDIAFADQLSKDENIRQGATAIMSAATGTDIKSNFFAGLDQASDFFGSLGFLIDSKRDYTEVAGELISAEKLKLSRPELISTLGSYAVWKLLVKRGLEEADS